MFEKLEKCPLCESGHFTNYLICKDHSVSKEEFAIVQCNDCRFLFTNPRPHPDSLHQYYESDEYISHQNKGNSIINILYRIARYFTLKRKVNLVNKYSEHKGHLLDFGCGTGHFLDAANKDKWKTTGLEPNVIARKQAEAKQLNVVESIEHLPTDKKFDLITMWHVLEHIPNLNTTLSKLYKMLSKKGTLIVAVPNHNSYDARIFDKYWAGYDVPRHLYHFDHESIKNLMKKYKLKVKHILPMKLDAYYVSLLSNKYKHNGHIKPVKSLITGYKSNASAIKNELNYSSNIYIIRK